MSIGIARPCVDRPGFYSYCIYQVVVSTNLKMEGLTLTQEQCPEIRFVLGEPRIEPAIEVEEWYHEYLRRSDGTPWLSCARNSAGYLIREHTVGDFLVSRDGSEVICHPWPEIDPFIIQETFIYPILPLVLNLRGRDGFHAAAVKIGPEAVAFAGASGTGKSTLAAYLHSLGHPVLTDEYLGLDSCEEGIVVRLGPQKIRLWSPPREFLNKLKYQSIHADVYSSKMILGFKQEDGNGLSSRIPLGRIYFLLRRESASTDQAIEIETLSGTQAFLKLMDQSYRLDIADPGMLQRQMDLFTRMVSEGRVKLLKLAWGYDLLPRTANLILRDCASGAAE